MAGMAGSFDEHNLPTEQTPLIGRERDVAAVRAYLLAPTTPLVTLVGPGGMGKTTLALHLAHDVLGDFPDGVYFIDLTPLAQPDLIPSQIVRAVGAEEMPGRTAQDTLIDHCHNRHTLLLLDNFEHLLPGAKAVGGLLRACPGVRVLATSREALRLREEQVYPLPPLLLPDRDRLPDPAELIRNPAIDLFVQRARAVRPGFQLTAENAAAVAAIVARLDGLPLAIELAAARVRLFPPTVLLQRLEASPLGLLVGGARDAPERQQTVRATIAWSYDLLEAAEQRFFRRLGVFADGFTVEAVEAVVTGTVVTGTVVTGTVASGEEGEKGRKGEREIDVLEGLESLLDKSLIVRLPMEEELRFGLLETLRAFALEQLTAAGEEPVARQAHFDHYATLAETAAPELRSPRQSEWLVRLAADENNLRAALQWSLDGRPGEAWRGLQLTGALGDFWYFGNQSIEGRRWLERVLTAAKYTPSAPEETAILARAYSAAGTMAWLQGDYVQAKSYHEQALDGYRDIDNPVGVINSLINIGVQEFSVGAYDEARSIYDRSMALIKEGVDQGVRTVVLSNRGLLELAAGDLAAAHDFLEQALTTAKSQGDSNAVLGSLSNLGQVEFQLGRLERANELLGQAYGLAIESGNPLHRIDIALGLGRLREMQGKPDEARRLSIEALELANRQRLRRIVADALEQVAFALNLLGEPARGARLLGSASALRRRLGTADLRDNGPYYDARLPAVRAALGEEAFTAQWDAGRRLSRDEAVALATQEVSATRQSTTTDNRSAGVSPAKDPLAGLTPREREVALLMARGLTNEEIGSQLFITLKTVEKHAGNALGKLGFRSRVELAAWLAAGGPRPEGM